MWQWNLHCCDKGLLFGDFPWFQAWHASDGCLRQPSEVEYGTELDSSFQAETSRCAGTSFEIPSIVDKPISPRDAYTRKWTVSVLLQVMAWCRTNTNTIFYWMKFELKYKFYLRKMPLEMASIECLFILVQCVNNTLNGYISASFILTLYDVRWNGIMMHLCNTHICVYLSFIIYMYITLYIPRPASIANTGLITLPNDYSLSSIYAEVCGLLGRAQIHLTSWMQWSESTNVGINFEYQVIIPFLLWLINIMGGWFSHSSVTFDIQNTLWMTGAYQIYSLFRAISELFIYLICHCHP